MRLWNRVLAVGVYAILPFVLVGCGGGGGGGGGGDENDVNANGLWTGTFSEEGASARGSGLIYGDELYFLSEAGALYKGTVSVDGEELQADLTAYDEGGVFATGQFEGTVDARDSIAGTHTATYSDGTETRGAASLEYVPIYERDASLGRIADTWAVYLSSGYSNAVTIQEDGAVSGQDSDGCTFTGDTSVPDPAVNVYRFRVEVGSCGSLSGTYTGYGLLGDTESANDTLVVMLDSGERAIASRFLRGGSAGGDEAAPGTSSPSGSGGSTTDGSTTDGSTTDGSTTDGSTTDGSATDGSAGGGSTSGGSTTPPTISVQDAQVQEGDSGTTVMPFIVTLSPPAGGRVNVDYATADGTASAGEDYAATSGTLELSAGQTQRTVEVPVNGDTALGPNEDFRLILSNVSANAVLGDADATGTIINDDIQPLNDTGFTTFGDAATNTLDSEPADYPGQDASYGRDATAGGFDFAASGACVHDRVTGLVWEVKTTTGWRAASNRYTWYNTDPQVNGGNPGTAGTAGTCALAGSMTSCNTRQYVAAANEAALCGYTDWRLPTRDELRSIVDYGRTDPATDTAFFPNTVNGRYWAAGTEADVVANAHGIYFTGGWDNDAPKSLESYVRLVRER